MIFIQDQVTLKKNRSLSQDSPNYNALMRLPWINDISEFLKNETKFKISVNAKYNTIEFKNII